MRTPTASPADVAPEEILSFLGNPASYPHRPDTVELVHTHISCVALAGKWVYKVKKPVDLGFVDFSTLEKRRRFCEEEVWLNRRLCAAIYGGVVPVFRSEEGLTFEENGPAVEYAIKMHRLGEEHFLDRRLARGEVALPDLDRVVEKLAALYRGQSSSAEIAIWGRTDRLRVSTDENFAQTEPHVGTALSRPAFEAIRYYTNRFYDHQAPLINRRRAHGHIIDGHGDLRLEHVHLTPEDVCIFDCIEFSRRLRSVDVASDVAFLAMDLDFSGRPDLSVAFARRVAEALDDPELLKMIDFYKCYRAYVRGKVEGMRSREAEVPEAERTASRERATRYFQWALQYATAGSGPAVIAVMGRVGTGKSTQAKALAETLGWDVVRSDRVRKEQAGVPLRERGGAAERADLYAEERTRQVYTALGNEAVRRAGHSRGTVLDATFGKRTYRDAMREALNEHDIPHCFVELTASDAAIKRRLKAREKAASVSDARLEDLAMLSAGYEAPDALEDAYHFRAETEAHPETTTTEILKHLVRFALQGNE